MAAVVVERVCCTFRHRRGDVAAVRDLSLELADGELLVLAGPSGCGKTTTLRMIAGLQEPTSGRIMIDGVDAAGVSPKDRNIAMVFQGYALYPHLNVYDNLGFPLKMRGTPRDERDRTVRAVAERLGISHLLPRRPSTLSGGEQQRVALGRAMVRKPRVFLLDEPLANLDPARRRQMRSEFTQLQRELRATVVYVTHDQEEAMTLGDRIAVMRSGVLQQVGPPMETYERPVNAFVAGFLGTPPMNFLRGELQVRCDGLLFQSGDGRCIIAPNAAGPTPTSATAILGVRPQHVRLLSPSASANAPSVACTVEWVEKTGESTNVHAATASGARLVCRTASASEWRPGTAASAVFEPLHLHLFAADEGGRRLN